MYHDRRNQNDEDFRFHLPQKRFTSNNRSPSPYASNERFNRNNSNYSGYQGNQRYQRNSYNRSPSQNNRNFQDERQGYRGNNGHNGYNGYNGYNGRPAQNNRFSNRNERFSSKSDFPDKVQDDFPFLMSPKKDPPVWVKRLLHPELTREELVSLMESILMG